MTDTFIPIIDCFLIFTFFFFPFLEYHSFEEPQGFTVGEVWLLLPKEIAHFIAEDPQEQDFIFGVE